MLKLTRIAAVALIGLAVLLAVIALMIGRKPAAPATAAPVAHSEAQAITVVEAVARLPAGEPITANGLRLAQRTTAVAGAATSISAVVGKVPVQDIAEGTAISSNALAQGFSLQLRPGERALAVPVDELVGAGNRILPGDFVDVFLNLRDAQPNASGPAEAAQTRLLLSRLRVLSYGQQDIAPVTGDAVAGNEGDTRNDPAPRTSPAMAAAMARATRPPSRHAARCWQCRWPMPTGCCWVRSRESCSWPCATRLIRATRPCTVSTGAWRDRSFAWTRCRTAARAAAAGEPCLRRHRW